MFLPFFHHIVEKAINRTAYTNASQLLPDFRQSGKSNIQLVLGVVPKFQINALSKIG